MVISYIFIQVVHPLYICKRNQQAAMDKEDFGLIAETHHSAVFHISLGNLKISLLSRHLNHPLIFEYHPGQSPPPFEQSVC